jgi:hypothetical protein
MFSWFKSQREKPAEVYDQDIHHKVKMLLYLHQLDSTYQDPNDEEIEKIIKHKPLCFQTFITKVQDLKDWYLKLGFGLYLSKDNTCLNIEINP